MLGQAHPPQRRLLPLAAFALAVLIAPAVGGAGRSQSVTSLRAHDAAIAAKSRAAVLGLYTLDAQLVTANARVDALHRQTTTLRAERALLRRQLAIARRGSRLAQQQLASRIRTLYDQGAVEPLEIVFGARSLDEAMANLDSLSQAANQGEDVVKQLKAARATLGRASHELAARESALAAATRRAQATLAELAGDRARRQAYISSLAGERRLTREQIARVVARAHEAQVRSAQLARMRAAAAPVVPVAAPTAAPAAPTGAGGTVLTVTATGYALAGTTATGLPVGWGIAAVDPSVIPLGTHFTVPGYGEAVAADTGGGVAGDAIDLWFPSVAQANAWGRRTITIVLH